MQSLFATATLKLNDSPDSGGPSRKKGLEKVHLKKPVTCSVYADYTTYLCLHGSVLFHQTLIVELKVFNCTYKLSGPVPTEKKNIGNIMFAT